MKYKRIIAVLLVTVLLFFSACSNDATVENTIYNSTTAVDTTTTTEKTTVADTTTEKPTTTTTQRSITTTKGTTTTTKKATTSATKKNTTTLKLTTNPITTKKETTTKAVPCCILTINCSTILSNMSDLKEGHESYVPANGYLLNGYKVEYTQGDTAYDILKKGCDDNGIKLTATQSVYGIYVAGIGNLDEKDCGRYSGWLYSVNGTQPNVACSKYIVNENDTIEFHYTCNY